MKTVKLSLFGRLATSSHRQRARPARPFVRPSSLSPSPLIRREASISFLIGRAKSRDIAQCRETTRTFVAEYKPGKCRHCITLSKRIPKKDVFNDFSRHPSDSAESSRISHTREPARSQRISQTLRIGSTPGIRQIPAHGFSRTSHRPPQPATA